MILPFVDWRTKVWDSQNQLMMVVLNGATIKQIQQFYGELDRINAIRNLLVKLETEFSQDAGNPDRPLNTLRFPEGLTDDPEELHDMCLQIVERLIDSGNPLAETQQQWWHNLNWGRRRRLDG